MSPKMRLFIVIPALLLTFGCDKVANLLPHRPMPQQTVSDTPQSPQPPRSPFASALASRTLPVGNGFASSEPPLSRVGDDVDGTLYSRDINRINDAANIGTPDGYPLDDLTIVTTAEQTWLATDYGVKHLDRAQGMTRSYGIASGLPGTQVVAIVGDANGVWCLVRDRETVIADAKNTPKLHLCRYDAAANRWHEQATIDAPYRRYVTTTGHPYEGRCLLALTDHFVAVIGGVVASKEDAFARLYDRQTSKMTVLPWNPDLGADADAVLPTVLLADDHGVTVGTDHGLLRWNFASSAWSRTLPDRFIDCGASGFPADSGTVWVASHARPRPGEFGDQPNAAPPEWNLTRVTLASGRATSWSAGEGAGAAGASGVSDQSPRPTTVIGMPSRNDDLSGNLCRSVPCGIFVDGDSVWTAHRVPRVNSSGYSASYASSNSGDSGWLCLNAASGVWSYSPSTVGELARFAPRSSVRISNRVSSSLSSDSDPALPVSLPVSVHRATTNRPRLSVAVVPNGAVRVMALCCTCPLPVGGGEYVYQETEQFCIRQRFPDWLNAEASPGALGATGATVNAPPAASGVSSGVQTLMGPIPDPEQHDKVWIIDESGANVIQCLPASLPTSLQEERREGGYRFSGAANSVPAWESVGGAVHYFPAPLPPVRKTPPLPVGILSERVMVRQIVPVEQSVFCLLGYNSPDCVARLVPSTGKWTLYDRAKGLPRLYGTARMIHGAGDSVWIDDGLNVYRYNAATDSWDRVFEESVGHSPLPEDQEPPKPALLGSIGYEPKFCIVDGETDIVLRKSTEEKDKPYLTRPTIYRFAGRDNHLIAMLPFGQSDYRGGEAVAVMGKDLWVGMNQALFHVRRDAPPDASWQTVALPVGVVGGEINGIYAGPNGGLWIISSECAYLWKHPHE